MPDIAIGGFQKSSLIDYPEKISAIVFTQGCNFRCPYCHNPELIGAFGSTSPLEGEVFFQYEQKPANIRKKGEGNCNVSELFNPSPEFLKLVPRSEILPSPSRGEGNARKLLGNIEVLDFLKTRVGKLDGVVISGGEPTLQKGLVGFIKEIKGLGFSVKLDTNGSNPEMLKQLIDEKLIDYIAMDIKAPIDKYSEVACVKAAADKILKSVELVKNSGLDYEFRTTVVKSQLGLEDFEKIGEMINGAKQYYLQKFVPTKTLDESFLKQSTCSDEEFGEIVKILEKYVDKVEVR